MKMSAESAPADDLHANQRAFAAAILDPDLPVPPGLIGPDGDPSTKRFAVYRNNVVAGLTEALKAAFPVVRRLVGDDFFAAMAGLYAREAPPSSPIMLDYGAGFADFIGTFAPASTLPYLRDVARLERAWVEAYHAADADPIDPATLGRIAPDRLADVRLVLHPSARIIRAQYPAVAIWQMNTGGGTSTPVAIENAPQDALVIRPVADVEMRLLPAGAAIFLQKLLAGMSVTEATLSTLDDSPAFDLADTLGGLLAARAVIGWHLHYPRHLIAKSLVAKSMAGGTMMAESTR